MTIKLYTQGLSRHQWSDGSLQAVYGSRCSI